MAATCVEANLPSLVNSCTNAHPSPRHPNPRPTRRRALENPRHCYLPHPPRHPIKKYQRTETVTTWLSARGTRTYDSLSTGENAMKEAKVSPTLTLAAKIASLTTLSRQGAASK